MACFQRDALTTSGHYVAVPKPRLEYAITLEPGHFGNLAGFRLVSRDGLSGYNCRRLGVKDRS
jgi:hypothetical protein